MNVINLQNIIRNIDKNSNEISNFILKIREILLKEDDNNESNIVNEIIFMLSKYKNHPQLIELLANTLHLSNNPELYQQYEIEDLKKLYDLNAKNQNLSYMSDQVFFYWNILDDGVSTKNLIFQYKNMLKNQIKEFDGLLLEIDDKL